MAATRARKSSAHSASSNRPIVLQLATRRRERMRCGPFGRGGKRVQVHRPRNRHTRCLASTNPGEQRSSSPYAGRHLRLRTLGVGQIGEQFRYGRTDLGEVASLSVNVASLPASTPRGRPIRSPDGVARLNLRTTNLERRTSFPKNNVRFRMPFASLKTSERTWLAKGTIAAPEPSSSSTRIR